MVTIRPVTLDDLDSCRTAFNDHLKPERAETRVKEIAATCKGTVDGDAWVGIIDGTVAGVGMIERIDGGDPAAFTGTVPLSILGDTGLIKNMYIQDGFCSRGIGSALMDTLLDQAQNWHLDAAVAEAWIRTDTLDAVPLLEKYGFTEVYRSRAYWDSDSCSACGPASRCTCQGALYMKLL